MKMNEYMDREYIENLNDFPLFKIMYKQLKFLEV